jgi:hypothetical protein
MLILAGGGRGLPMDYELQRWTRVGADEMSMTDSAVYGAAARAMIAAEHEAVVTTTDADDELRILTPYLTHRITLVSVVSAGRVPLSVARRFTLPPSRMEPVAVPYRLRQVMPSSVVPSVLPVEVQDRFNDTEPEWYSPWSQAPIS